jgi:hypothetical protein
MNKKISLIEAALNLTKGCQYNVFPTHIVTNGLCSCGKSGCKGKHPKTPNGHLDASCDEEQLKEWFNNENTGIGIPTGRKSGFFVIDIDFKHKAGKSSWEALQNDFQLSEWDTVSQKTPSGGLHLFFQYPEISDTQKVKTQTDLPGYPGIDIRGDGGYVLVAPSKGYQWENSSLQEGKFDVAPQALLERLLANTSNNIYITPKEPTIRLEGGRKLPSIEVDNIKAALEYIDCETYSNWWETGAQLHSTNDKRAFEWWDEWSKKTKISNQYNYKACLDTWNKYKTNKPNAQTIQTLYKRAHDAGWQGVNEPIEFIDDMSLPNDGLSHASELVPLKSHLPSVMPFDSKLLPIAFEKFVDDVARRMQAPPDFIAVGLMVSLSAIVGRRFVITPKQIDTSWEVTPNLWGMVIGRPSVKKTPTLKEALKPFEKLELQAKKTYQRELEDYKADEMLSGIKSRQAQKEAEKAVKEGNEAEASKLLKESHATPSRPTMKRLHVNNVTVEKLGELLQENPNGLLTFRDELSGWLKDLSKEEKTSDRAFYLEGWNGNSGFTFDRIGRGTTRIDTVTLSVLGGIQPGKIRPFIKDAISGGVSDDGLLQRFQLMVYPDIPHKWEYIDEPYSQTARESVFNVFSTIDGWDVMDNPYYVRFSTKAQDTFVDWLTQLEHKIRDDLHPAIENHLSKYRSLIPSLALLIHIADNLKTPTDDISLQSLEKAIRWGEYLESHAQRVYSMGADSTITNAKLIVKRFDKLGDIFSKREIQRKGWVGLTTNEAIQEALDLLVDYGYLREVKITTNGRLSSRYCVNPLCNGKFADK